MSRHSKGDRVVALQEINGGWTKSDVPKGSKGVVTDASWFGSNCDVLFHIEGFWSDSDVELNVNDDQVG